VLGIYRYNNGVAKLGMKRQYHNKQGEVRNSSLGRLTMEEVKAIVPTMKEMMTALSKIPAQPTATPPPTPAPAPAPAVADKSKFQF
jgi:hypothetical protein